MMTIWVPFIPEYCADMPKVNLLKQAMKSLEAMYDPILSAIIAHRACNNL
jgi:hypothetical protein